MVGQALGHFRILQRIGAGGMGEVYRAHDEPLDRDVALKILPAESFSDANARARLLREAKSAAALNHPNICTVHEVGEAEGQAYIAMELVEGQPLNTRLADGPLPAEQVLRYGIQIADALSHAHERNIIHRDLKCANVVITKDGRAKVLDFGLAKRLSESEMDEVTRSQASLTAPGAVMGTLAYMAPEQLRGQPADARSDIWALGVMLYEMSAGARPFQGQTGFELSSEILNQRPPELPAKLPLQLKAVIERCLEKEPGRRYQRAGEVRAALEAIQAGKVPSWAGWRYRLARQRWLVPLAAVLLLVAVLTGLDVGGLRTRLTGGPRTPRIESLAVLPFDNLSGDSTQDYFADGMTEALITDLARLGGLKRVIARGSVMRYKGTKKSLSEIARELKVDALITGAVLRSGDRVRLTAQLINPETGEQLWTERYERDVRDVLSLQNELTRAIAGEIRLKLAPEERTRLASAGPVNPEAYDAYLKGRVQLWKLTPQGMDTALEYFQLALQKDPDYALAHLGIGMVWAARSNIGDLPPQEGWLKAKSAALKILDQDETLAEAHGLLGVVLMQYDWNWPAAERELRRAIEINPNHADAHRFYSIFLTSNGRREPGLAEIRRALELDPLSPIYQLNYGMALSSLGRYDDAIAQYQKLLRTDPDFSLTHGHLWGAFHKKGMYDQAIAEAIKFHAGRGDGETADVLARGYAEGGYGRAMQLAAEKLATRSKLRYVHPTAVAQLYVYAGEKERALDWLEKAYEGRDSQLFFLQTAPTWDSLRDQARFQALLRKLNLPP